MALPTIILVTACQSSGDSGTGKADTARLNKPEERLVQDSLTLPESEITDDSVFTDGSRPASWGTAGIQDPVAFKRFLKQFQYWVASGQREKVAGAVSFPMMNPPVKDRNEFLAKYDSLITPNVKKAIASQDFRQIFRNFQGAMIGNGELWFTQKDQEFVLISLNTR
jgi:hypothetical protein